MFENYLKIAIRTLLKNRKLTLINIFGLAVGISCSLLIFLFIQDELRYDKFHQDSDNIYRVVKDFVNDDGTRIPDATTPAALAPAMQREIPDVVKITRIHPNWGGTTRVEYGDKQITEERIWRVDSSFFDVFSFKFITGNAQTALAHVNSIVLTESAAKRFFGEEDPMGKVLQLNGQDNGLNDVTVTAVIQDVPAQSHFHFDYLLSFRRLPNSVETNWGQYNYYTYVKVAPQTSVDNLEKMIQDVYERNQEDRYSDFYLQPLTSIHLNSQLKWELEPNGDRIYVYIFSIIGLFILAIAGINYINLSTARSSLRAKETGIRKVSGAQRTSLIIQFLLESIILCVTASIVALSICYAVLPFVNEITLKQLNLFEDPEGVIYLFMTSIVIGLIAGIFPALYLSSFKPVAVLKGLRVTERGALGLRKSLVVVQFTISTALIIGVIIISQQMNFVRSAKLGFDKDHIIVIRNAGGLSRSERNAFLTSIKELSGIKNATTSNTILGRGFSTTRIRPIGSEQEQQLNFASVYFDFLEVMGIEIKEGRGFSPEFPGDTINNGTPGGPLQQRLGGIVINERAVKDFALGTSPVGKRLIWSEDADTTYFVEVIGVAKDFHFTSLRNEIKPYGFLVFTNFQSNFTVKLSNGNIPASIEQLNSLWTKSFPELPFEYSFLDETYASMYVAEARFQKVFISLVILGIIIACLGLFALATFSAEQRIKEIGIRKVLGASVAHVVFLLSKDFLKLVIISIVIAIPVAIYGIQSWLDSFAYKIGIDWWVFLVASVIAVLIAFITISTQAYRAAVTDPARSLRTE